MSLASSPGFPAFSAATRRNGGLLNETGGPGNEASIACSGTITRLDFELI